MAIHLDPAPAQTALATARSEEAAAIRQALGEDRVVGVFGEAEVGKTQTIRQAIAGSGLQVLYLDLAWAASDEHVGFLLARQIAETIAPGQPPRRFAAGAMLPPSLAKAQARLVEILGGGLQEAARRWPSGRYDWPTALESLDMLASTQEVLLWVDHLEAPGLTFRHPLKLSPLLWSLSELLERTEGLRLLLSGRAPAQAAADGPRAPFHQSGLWLSVQAPGARTWRRVAELVGAPADQAEQLAGLTAGHPRTMLLALRTIAHQAVPGDPEQLLQDLATNDDGLARRAMEHARSLHRLGGQVLTQAALGQRPYAAAQRGATTTQDLSKALKRLRLAGLLQHEDRWSVVNPLLAMSLRAISPPESPTSVRPPWS